MQRTSLDSKTAGETLRITFDFTEDLAVGETIPSAGVVCTVWSGTDADPSLVVSGSASSNAGVVTQTITGGVTGVIYQLRCVVVTNQGQTLERIGLLPVVPES